MVAGLAVGFPGVVLVSANSITKAVTGRHLSEVFAEPHGLPDSQPAAAAPPAIGSAPSELQELPVVAAPEPTESRPARKKVRPPSKSRGRLDSGGKLKT